MVILQTIELIIVFLGVMVATLTFCRSSRPYVGVNHIKIEYHEKDRVGLEVAIINAGNIIAYNINSYATWSTVYGQKIPITPRSNFILLPNQISYGKPQIEAKNGQNIPFDQIFLDVKIEYAASPSFKMGICKRYIFEGKYQLLENQEIFSINVIEKNIYDFRFFKISLAFPEKAEIK